MCARHEILKVLQGAELRIHVLVVLYGIIGAEGAFAVQFAYRMHRHEPYDIHAQVLEARQFVGIGFKSASGSALAQVHLVYHSSGRPVHMGTGEGFVAEVLGTGRGRIGRGCGKHDSGHYSFERCLEFHNIYVYRECLKLILRKINKKKVTLCVNSKNKH